MSSNAGLYTFSDETRHKLFNFRMTTSRSETPQAVIYLVDKKKGNEIRQESDATVYDSLEDVADSLSENTARFVLLSYPSPHTYVLIYYNPDGPSEMKMLYAGAREVMRNESGVNKVFDVKTTEELLNVPGLL